jgi:glycosyltransferase involved in cell wall biosynthesis
VNRVASANPWGVVQRWLRRRRRRKALAVLAPKAKGRVRHEPNPADAEVVDNFRFFAVLGTWMEEDVVEATVKNAFAQGVEAVYVVDNASTDATVERAVDAGATLVETFATKHYEERVRILLMNGVVARMSLASEARHVWWLWLDADEFPEGPDGMTIAEYLRTLDRRFRVVGSTYYNHFPTDKPEYISGFHPLDFQPLCERYTSKHVHHCKQPHWKHPLQRFDDEGPFILASGGFHTGTLRTREPLYEPTGGIVTHHVCYREEEAARRRLELLCGASERNASNDAIGNRTIQRRFDSLDAVYAHDWARVNNLRGDEPMNGVHPVAWPHPDSSRRWYSAEDVATATKKWRADHASALSG